MLNPLQLLFYWKKKSTLPLVNVKILSPAAFQSEVYGSSGEMAAGTDHIQDVLNIRQKLGDNQSPQNESSFKKMCQPQPACSEFSACKH